MDTISIRKKYQGLWGVNTKVLIKDSYSLSLVYTPGVGKSCTEIAADPLISFELTNRANSIAIITDCSNFADFETINPLCAMPEAEAKAIFYKEFAGIDAYPIIVNTIDTEELAQVINALTPNFAAFDLEFLSPVRSMSVEQYLKHNEFAVLYNYRLPYLYDAIQRTGLSDKISPDMIIPAVMRGVIDTRSREITDAMLDAAASAFIEANNDDLLDNNKYNFKLASKIASNVAKAAIDEGVARTLITPQEVENKYLSFAMEGSKALFKPERAGYKSTEHDLSENSLELHRKAGGVIETGAKINVKNPSDWNLLISDRENEKVIKEIELDYTKAFELTSKGNLVAIISDGSAVLGFGNIGAEAALPVMEGKAALFKNLAGVDAVPICLNTQDTDELVDIITRLTPVFGGVNLEDISAPRCFEIEQKLIERTHIPIFHDDQHGTAVVVLAGVMNALKLTGKKPGEVKVAMSGAGAAGQSVARLLVKLGIKNILICDTKGIVYAGREFNNKYLEATAKLINPDRVKGNLADAMCGADIFIGVSVKDIVTQDMIKSMNENSIVFALANPFPEIMPDKAKEAGAYIVATGRSDFKNQVNNSIAFPGIFRGALDVRAKLINDEMKIAAAQAIADLIKDDELSPDYIIPHALDLRVPPLVARAVAQMALDTGVAQYEAYPERIEEITRNYLYEGVLSRGL